MQLKKISQALLMIGTTAAISQFAHSADANSDDTKKVEKITVTGSNIKRVNTEAPAPIQIISKKEIERSGFSTISDVLQNIPGNNSGGFNESNVNSFAAGAAAVSLRGLGAQATLVLVNGRRMTNYGFANGGQSTFVDLNTIPLEAVERVEILKDGASAIYGSDAMAGVINIILLPSYQGFKTSASAGISARNDGQTTRLTATAGFGDLATQRWNMFLNAEAYDRKPIYQRDRDAPFNSTDRRVIGQADGRSTQSYPGNIYTYNPVTKAEVAFLQPLKGCAPENLNGGPAVNGGSTLTGRCLLNANDYIVASPKSKRENVYSRATFQLSEDLQAFVEAGRNETKTQTISTPTALTSWLRATDLQLVTVSPTILPVGNPNNPTKAPVSIRYAFGDVGPRTQDLDSKLTRFVGGLKGTTGNWDWDVAASLIKSETAASRHGYVLSSVFNEVVQNGTYIFGDRSKNSAALYDRLAPELVRTGDTSTKSVDLKVSNSDLYQLPAGSVGFAAGVGFRKEDLHDNADSRIASGDVIGLGATSANGERKASNVFVELSVPLRADLEAQFAARYDHFSDFGNSTTPKIGLKWTPAKDIAVRGTYAEGFRAPSLPEISQSVLTGFYNGLQDPSRCPTTAAAADCNGSFPALIGANPTLKPETSKSYTTGIIFEPNRSINVSVDFYYINRKHEIGALDPEVLLGNESQYPGLVIRGPVNPAQPNIPGPIQYMKLNYQNLGETKTKGVDFDLRTRTNLGEFGVLSTGLNATYTISYLVRPTEESDLLEYNGTHNQPRIRANFTTTLERGPWATTLSANAVGSFSYSGSPLSACPASVANYRPGGCEIGSFTTYNLNVGYTGFKGWRLAANIQNLTNRMPPIDTTYTQNYDYNYHNIIGRFYTVSASYSFK
ncbi:TonB-dependent receptor [Burkholderiaceae bacterium DAT-1]|nr:TonB-dependent receptor [Burkholderiaceae bacterium DAT-1]